MKSRCLNKNNHRYKQYGGRGITICPRWIASFDSFYEDMGPKPSKKHSLERINNDGPYSPENCRWATFREQMLNTRRTRYATLNGERRAVAAWCEILGLNPVLIGQRIRRDGMDPESALIPGCIKPKVMRGEDSNPAKLTEAKVIDIRRLSTRGISHLSIGRIFGVSGTQIGNIISRKHWKHI